MRRTLRTAAASGIALFLSACGGGTPSADSPSASEAASMPTHRGDVWEIDPGAPAEAQVLAYLNGLHAFVRKGDDIYSGTTKLRTQTEGGALVITLAGNSTARLMDADDGQALVFADGAKAALRAHQDAGEKP